ncbi:MAG: hypothetical protein NT033_08495 [Candidatus Omnitrophica bacterium]|nr:hypothetical protein [Candidatus Omnitrophota bacterium]
MKNGILIILLVLYCTFILFNIPLHKDLYFVLCCIVLAGLIFLWRNVFLEKKTDIIFYALCLLGFNSAIYLNIRSANTCIFEQFLLWLALYYYLKDKLLIFCALVVIAATLKIDYIFFLLLLFFAQEQKRKKYFVGSLGALVLLSGVIFVLNPHIFLRFFAAARSDLISGGGVGNFSTFSFVSQVWQIVRVFGLTALGEYYGVVYFLIVLILFIISFRAVRVIKGLRLQDEKKWLIFFACALYAIINPRFRDYNYIILILPTYFLIKKLSCIKAENFFLTLIILSAIYITFPGLNIAMYFLWTFYPLLLAYAVWVLYLCEMNRLSKAPN